MVGLLDAISNAGEWDEQISEGKSLSEREEAVLQLIDNSRRKHQVGGKLYAIERREVFHMMQRYDMPSIES